MASKIYPKRASLIAHSTNVLFIINTDFGHNYCNSKQSNEPTWLHLKKTLERFKFYSSSTVTNVPSCQTSEANLQNFQEGAGT